MPSRQNKTLIAISFSAAFVEDGLEAADGEGGGIVVVGPHEVAAVGVVVEAQGEAQGVVVVAVATADGHVFKGLGAEDEVEAEFAAFFGDLGEEKRGLGAVVAVGGQGGCAQEFVELIHDDDEGWEGLAADAAVVVDVGDFTSVGFAALAEEELPAFHLIENGVEDEGGARGIGTAMAQLDMGQGAEEFELGATHVHEDEAQGIGRGGFAGGEDEVFQEGGFPAAGAAADEGVVAAGARAKPEADGRGSLLADDDAKHILGQGGGGGLALEVGLDALAEVPEVIGRQARAEAELLEDPPILGELPGGIELGALHGKANGLGDGLLEGGQQGLAGVAGQGGGSVGGVQNDGHDADARPVLAEMQDAAPQGIEVGGEFDEIGDEQEVPRASARNALGVGRPIGQMSRRQQTVALMGEGEEFIEPLAKSAALMMDAAEALFRAGQQALDHGIGRRGRGGDDLAGGGDG